MTIRKLTHRVNHDLLPVQAFPDFQTHPKVIAGLAVSMSKELDLTPRIEGQVPKSLQGCLYRNGAGLFDRRNGRKRMILDGDGLIQKYVFNSGKVRYINRFVRTKKYLEETRDDRFIFSSWTTRAPGGWVNNFFSSLENTASVTVFEHANRLYATDEMQIPYVLDPDTLNTLGVYPPNKNSPKMKYQAHTKWESVTRRRVFLSLEPGPMMRGTTAELNENGESKLSLNPIRLNFAM